MDNEGINQILQYLDKIGEKLGIGTEKIWPWLVRQVYIDVFISLVFLLVSSISLYTLFRYAIAHWKYPSQNEDVQWYSITENDHQPLWGIILILFAIIWASALILFLSDGFGFLNPEYYALQKLLSNFKSK
uniref:Uncharacterized protein n=1 Tax=viral metagenome TaxID=1070528 RepID=A0A6H2A1E3_9ZZZZ